MWKTVLVLLLALLALCMFLPILIRVDLRKEGTEVGCVGMMSPLAGFFGVGVRLLPGPSRMLLLLCGRRMADFGLPGRRKSAEPVDREKPEGKPAREPSRDLRGAISRVLGQIRRFRSPVLRFLRWTLRAFRLHRLRCDLGFGTGNPAWTGRIFGWGQALRGLTGTRVEVELRPDFRRAVFEGTLSVCVGIRLYLILTAVLLLGVEVMWIWGRERVARRGDARTRRRGDAGTEGSRKIRR